MNIPVKVKPGCKQPGITVEGGSLILRVRERAVEGAANEACIRALANALGVPPSRVRLLRGAHSRAKVFAVEGVDEPAARKRLNLGVS
ncbi:MAG TPA: DUF167 domain-containing protein [Candidatus Baltobacteraceae bacterium]|nr:DUF167 domain-containing protein [Candidatus Baltobacteraceae bacterium]